MPDGTYRMVVCTGLAHADAVGVAEEQVREWLKAQHYDEAPPEAGSHRVGDQAVLDRDSGGGEPGTVGYARWRLREYTSQGVWQTSLSLATPPGRKGRSWAHVEAELLPGRPGSQPVKAPVPRLARALLDRYPAVDGPHRGAARVHAMPTVIEEAAVDEILEELCDPERRLPIVVASSPQRAGFSFEDWLAQAIDPVLRGCAGLAVLYALTPAAERVFNRELEHHRVYGGAVRTYLPGIDPAWPAEAARHRVLARRTMEEDQRRAAGLVAWLPRRLALETELPDALLGLPDLPAELDLLAEARTDAAECSRGYVERERRARTDELQEMRRRLREAERSEALLAAEYDDQYTELRESRTEVRRLRRRLLATESPGVEPETDLADRPPASFAELLGRLEEFPLLRFTGDPKETLDLDGQTDHPTWVRMTWDALLALQDYAEAAAAGRSGGDFRWWCENTPGDCHPFPPRKVIRDESRTVSTNGKWKRERLLPVPTCVNASGRVFMGAHLRIGGGGTAPRLHYHDDCSGTGKVYLGYIGLHLHNTRTN